MTWLDKHTFPRLARSTLNELQQNQHEKASLLCVRVQSPSGLALVPCASFMVDLSGQLRCWITHTYLNHTHKLPWYRILFFCYFRHTMLVRPVMKRLFFLGKPRKKRLASLARLIIIRAKRISNCYMQEKKNCPSVCACGCSTNLGFSVEKLSWF